MCTYVALFVLFGFVVFVKIMFIGCQHLAPGSPSTPILQFLILDLVKGRDESAFRWCWWCMCSEGSEGLSQNRLSVFTMKGTNTVVTMC